MEHPPIRTLKAGMAGEGPAAASPVFRLSPFMMEWLNGGAPANQLPISSVCNCHCLFCSNDNNPFTILGGVFRDVDDIKAQLCAMGTADSPIHLSDSLPGRISEGEALIHPRLFEVLDLVRSKFLCNTLRFTTNGSMLDEAFLSRLAEYRPIEITISLHSTRPDVWSKAFARSGAMAQVGIRSVELLERFGIDLCGTIVPLPRLCGWDDIERTYEYLVGNGARQMTLYWPGYSVRTRPEVVEEMTCPIEEFTAFAQRMRDRFPTPLFAFPDLQAPIDVSVATIVDQTLRGNPRTLGGAYDPVVWLASEAAHPRLARAVEEGADGASNRHHVVAVQNRTYGGNIIASGLLMVEDFVQAARGALETWPETQLFLLPTVPFDGLLRDLTGTSIHKFSDAVGRPAWLVANQGGIDPLLSARLVARGAPDGREIEPVVTRFSEALAAEELPPEAARMVAGFPVSTPIGPLEDAQLPLLAEHHRQRVVGSTPVSRRFEFLTATEAICLETWRVRNSPESLRRWTRLVEAEGAWRVASIEEGTI